MNLTGIQSRNRQEIRSVEGCARIRTGDRCNCVLHEGSAQVKTESVATEGRHVR